MKIHVLNSDNKTFCGGGVFGDKAITEQAARDMTSELYFDCEECYQILAPQDHNGVPNKKE